MFRALFLGLALVVAVPQSLAAPPDATGTINLVDRAHARLNVFTFDGQDAWIACTEETIVTIDGSPAWFVQLERDQIVKIQIDPATNTALRVDAMNVAAGGGR